MGNDPADKQIFLDITAFRLEGGETLPGIQIAYHTYGVKSNPVIWICHALTANSDVCDWWSGLCGPGKLFDPQHYYIICANVLGSCYGTTGPLSINPYTGSPYYHDFPIITVRDMVQAHIRLRKHLGINSIALLLGGSLGGQQVLEWAVAEPDLIQRIAPIATNARHSPWGIAFNATQRMAIENDPNWPLSRENAGMEGLKTARAIAMLSYRNYITYQTTQKDDIENYTQLRADSYQRYQGLKLSRRFNAFSYYRLSQAMDSHNMARNRGGGIKDVLAAINMPACVVAISSDVLYPPIEQQFLARYIPSSRFHQIDSLYGHDGFLLEFEALGAIFDRFLKET